MTLAAIPAGVSGHVLEKGPDETQRLGLNHHQYNTARGPIKNLNEPFCPKRVSGEQVCEGWFGRA